ncbi:hypothetical protein LTR37_017096 [Vermiconidia calcicola]|uniref:Uncharacterized protein n=1 Tax=Vermiconidia calcicola TaxID=1690605 RepID=A0ACC3MM76_9PEZI|nr:hypothetical protein LTR37_017096 [Vermiconidia calcicola]
MALEPISASPAVGDFKLLSEHEEQTPGTFFGGKPVLHLHSPGARLRISQEELQSQPLLNQLSDSGTLSQQGEQVVVESIDVWVTSRSLTLWSASKSVGVQIPYQTITVHAQEGSSVYLHLNLSDANTADEDLVFVQLRIEPTTIEAHEAPAEDSAQSQPNGHGSQSPAQALFKAISDCQELNPDPPEEGDGEFDETAPGATGWITSDNMQDFLDENGEFRMPEGVTVIGAEDEVAETEALGEGAGRTRTAAEADGADGAEDETKWQRTG